MILILVKKIMIIIQHVTIELILLYRIELVLMKWYN